MLVRDPGGCTDYRNLPLIVIKLRTTSLFRVRIMQWRLIRTITASDLLRHALTIYFLCVVLQSSVQYVLVHPLKSEGRESNQSSSLLLLAALAPLSHFKIHGRCRWAIWETPNPGKHTALLVRVILMLILNSTCPPLWEEEKRRLEPCYSERQK